MTRVIHGETAHPQNVYIMYIYVNTHIRKYIYLYIYLCFKHVHTRRTMTRIIHGEIVTKCHTTH